MMKAVKVAFRGWCRRPWLAALAVVTLGLGIGATALLFAALDSVVLRPVDLPQLDRLVRLNQQSADGGRYGVAAHSFLAWRRGSRALETVAAYRGRSVIIDLDGTPERLEAMEATGELLDLLGATPVLGRLWEPAGSGLVLSDTLWRRLGAPEDVLQLSLLVDGENLPVIGVAPPVPFRPDLGSADLWISAEIDEALAREKAQWGYSALARLALGATAATADAELDAISARLEAELPHLGRDWQAAVEPLREALTLGARRPLGLLFAAALVLLAIACVNVSHLLMAQIRDRRGEWAVRAALGAGRRRLLGQGLAETVLLALAGGVAGILLAILGLRLLRRLAAAWPQMAEVTLDARIVAAALAAALASSLAAGALPALSAARLGTVGLERSRSGIRGGRPGRWLVALEVALTLVMLSGATLAFRTVSRLAAVDPGFAAQEVMTLGVELPAAAYGERDARIATFRALVERLESLPGVAGAAFSGQPLPLTDDQGIFELRPPPGWPAGELRPIGRSVSPGYFDTLGIPLLAGEDFAAGDTWDSSRAVIVNQTLAERLWPQQRAVGREVVFSNGEAGRVVAVTADVGQHRPDLPAEMEVLVPWGSAPRLQHLVLRSPGDPEEILARATAEIHAALPGAAVLRGALGRDLVRLSWADRRALSLVLAVAGGLALLLAVAGIAGVVAYGVSRRRREIGVRMALGAGPAKLVGTLVRQAMAPVALGLAAGLAGSFAASRLLESQLYGVTPSDLQSHLAAFFLLSTAALLACWLPARRAARIDPSRVLQAE